MSSVLQLNAMAKQASGKGYENEDNYANIRFRFTGIENTHAVKVEKANVLVHCSDGWDRITQVCSVASILLDPFYRTLKGLMFLECIWQLMEQFPCAFEFNENVLLEIHDHVFFCQFGNFLGNCQKDREDQRVSEKNHSVWPFLVQRKPDFRNPLYKVFTVYETFNLSTVPYNIQ
ncbi:hypothetical protein CB1_002331001 [Camelus ferus]|nr:hypothetical protein CB1_002331001 [Camelus ferus]